MTIVKNLVGQKFGRLTVIANSGTSKPKKGIIWECKCDCGNMHLVSTAHLNAGNVVSCGCYGKQSKWNITHGMTNTRIYRIWNGMLNRCGNENMPNYHIYGGRGIKVCERWHLFENFYADTKEGYADNLTLDRYPNKDGNYEPNNFRWATWKQQRRNSNQNTYIEYGGEVKILQDWSEIYGISPTTIIDRIKRGWSLENVFLVKPDLSNKKLDNFHANAN